MGDSHYLVVILIRVCVIPAFFQVLAPYQCVCFDFNYILLQVSSLDMEAAPSADASAETSTSAGGLIGPHAARRPTAAERKSFDGCNSPSSERKRKSVTKILHLRTNKIKIAKNPVLYDVLEKFVCSYVTTNSLDSFFTPSGNISLRPIKPIRSQLDSFSVTKIKLAIEKIIESFRSKN